MRDYGGSHTFLRSASPPSVPWCTSVTLDSLFLGGGLFCFVSCSCGHLHPLEWLRKNLMAFCPYTRNECWLGGLEGRLEQVLFSAVPIQAHCLLERSGRDLWGLTEGILLGVWSDFTAKSTRSKKKKKSKYWIITHCCTLMLRCRDLMDNSHLSVASASHFILETS